MMKNYLKKQSSGSVLVAILIMMPFFMLITIAYLQLTTNGFRIARSDQFHTHAQLAADAGVDFGLQVLKTNGTWPGTGSAVELYNDGKVKTTYQVTITTLSPTAKTLTAVGRTFFPVTDPVPESTVTLQVDLKPSTASGPSGGTYSMITGQGGLSMEAGSQILGGDVFVNGFVSISGSTTSIGTSGNPLTLEVAHPTSSASPIDISGSGTKIWGTVRANNQSSGSGMASPGLVATSGVSTASRLPTYDRNAQKAAVTSTITGAAASCSGGTRTWPANLRINGDVTVQSGCKVTVMGNGWITGSLRVQGTGSELIVNNSLGTTRPTIMVDDRDGVDLSTSALLRSNSSNTGFNVITYWSDAPCSPDCTTLTSAQLSNSEDQKTIMLSNSASGPNTVFYARWTLANATNSGALGAVVGQTVELENNAQITYGAGVGNSLDATAPGAWVINGYRRTF